MWMRTLNLGRLGLVAVLLVAGAQPAFGQDAKETLLPGAKLLHKFPNEVYRIPVLLEPHQESPRLLVWNDAFDPAPVPKFFGEMMPKPQFDLVFWDVKANKEVHKMAFPKDTAPLSTVPAGMMSPATIGKFGTLSLSPNAKLLASVSTVYPLKPGKFSQAPTTTIKVYDPATSKWQSHNSFSGIDGPHILFLPDGAMLIFKEKWWAIQELGQVKPRKKFKLTRSPWYVPKANTYSIYSINNAALSTDGGRLAVAADGLITVYDKTTGETVLKAERAAPDSKGATSRQSTDQVALAFAPTATEPTLLTVETVTGAPKSFVLARRFDLKTRKEISRYILAQEQTKANPFGGALLPAWSRPAAYFNGKGEPRILLNGKLFDGTSGKALHQFAGGFGVLVSRDGQYLVRLTQKRGEKKLGIEVWSLDNSQ